MTRQAVDFEASDGYVLVDGAVVMTRGVDDPATSQGVWIAQDDWAFDAFDLPAGVCFDVGFGFYRETDDD